MEDRNRVSSAVDKTVHSSAADKAKGHVKETIGKVKEKVGSAIGDKKLEEKGAVQRVEGKTDRAKGEIKEKIEDVKGYVKAGAEVVKEKVDQARDKIRH